MAHAQTPSALKIADLDGDGRSDFASLGLQDRLNGDYRYRVKIGLTAGENSSFLVSSSQARFGLLVAAVDVDGDQDLDLVFRSAFDLRLIGVWINDGHGAFTEGDLASYSQSVGLQHDHLIESHYVRHAAAELPRIAGSRLLFQLLRQCQSIPKVRTSSSALNVAPRMAIDCGVSSLRGPPVSQHHNS
jgi:hypothetical protein